MIFDTHAHYDSDAFDSDREAVLTALPGQNVGRIVNPGCDVESSRAAVRLAARFAHVYAAVGIHPEECAGAGEEALRAIETLAGEEKVVAIGEIGLDYYWPENPPREFQQHIFCCQLELAQRLDLPVIIHDREAHGDTLDIIRRYPGVRGVFHCFSGSPEMAQELLRRGWYLGFDGPITYKNARRAPEVAAVTPPERIVIETDAPYLTPVPFRGKRNDSGKLCYVVEKLAEWKGMTPAEMERITWENGCRLFGLEEIV